MMADLVRRGRFADEVMSLLRDEETARAVEEAGMLRARGVENGRGREPRPARE